MSETRTIIPTVEEDLKMTSYLKLNCCECKKKSNPTVFKVIYFYKNYQINQYRFDFDDFDRY